MNPNELSLRDYFAAKAMQGMLAHGFQISYDGLAEIAYKQADAMIEERDKK
jgi:hypothetical protein